MGEICIMHAGFWLEKLKVKDHIQDKGIMLLEHWGLFLAG